jgi:hypothetical protein
MGSELNWCNQIRLDKIYLFYFEIDHVCYTCYEISKVVGISMLIRTRWVSKNKIESFEISQIY